MKLGSGWIRPLRLWCGLVLILFLLTHFANHSLGLISLDAMEQARHWILAPWRSQFVKAILLFALLAHWWLGLWLVYRRRTLRMPAWEALQIVFGLAVPPLLVFHVVGMWQIKSTVGTDDLYLRVLTYFWILDPMAGIRQFALFVVAWVHGCIGLHFWLRIRRWYPRLFPVLLSVVVVIPVVAALGLSQAAREVTEIHQASLAEKRINSNQSNSAYGNDDTDDYGYGAASDRSVPSSDYAANSQTSAVSVDRPFTLEELRDWVFLATWLLLALVVLARVARKFVERRKATVTIDYLDGPQIRIPVGWTLLEASRSVGVVHASVCGGRARCSTCRVRIAGDMAQLPAPTALEKRVLERINAAPNVRLACQLRPTSSIAVKPLLQVAIGRDSPSRTGGARGGEEREIAILFADLRGFTRVAERKLPYDVVFLLNRYFEAVGGAVAEAGGIANQYTGDGVMALFGVDVTPDVACREAINAAGDMIARVEALSQSLGGELESPLRIGIGIHLGSVVVGEMGYAGTRYLTAVGDAVNSTSRLEALTKDYDCDLVISETALTRAGISAHEYPHHDLALRNRDASLRVVTVRDARAFAHASRSQAMVDE